MTKYLKAFDGRKCPIDLDNPIIMLKGKSFGKNYERGSLVFPIGDVNEKPGSHSSEGWMSISTLRDSCANFCGVKIGRDAIQLYELLKTSGKELGIEFKKDGFFRKRNFFQEGKYLSKEKAVMELIDHYSLQNVPANIRNKSSKIINIKKRQFEKGIIFDKLENLCASLIMYDMGITKYASATQKKLFLDIYREKNPDAVFEDKPIYEAQNDLEIDINDLIEHSKSSFVGNLVEEIMETEGNFRRYFDYDAMDTSFFKTEITVKEINKKYLLNIHDAYVGSKPEEELGRILKKERALTSVGSNFELEPIEGWVSIDLDKAFRNASLTKDQISYMAQKSANEFDDYENFWITANEKNYSFDISITQNYEAEVTKANGNCLYLETKGEEKPFLNIYIKPETAITDNEEKTQITKMRDELTDLIEKNLAAK